MTQGRGTNGVAINALLIEFEFAVNFADRQIQRLHHQSGIFQLRHAIDLGWRAVNQGDFKIQRYLGISLRGNGFQQRIHRRAQRRLLQKGQNLVNAAFSLALNQQVLAFIQLRNSNFGLLNDHVTRLPSQDINLETVLRKHDLGIHTGYVRPFGSV